MKRRAWLGHLSAALPAILLMWGGWQQRWIGDDGFINLRVVRQLLAGHGFVFNIGERVEAVTSPLWVLLLTALGSTGLRLEALTVWSGALLSGLGLWLCGYATQRAPAADPDQPASLPLPFGTLAYAAIPAAWDYTTSGLENSLGLFWLGAAALLSARALEGESAPRRLSLAAAVVGLAPIVRPDYALLGLPFGLLLLFAAQGLRQRLAVAAFGAAPAFAFQVFRMGYFAALVPNTALAKEAFAANWKQGGHYFWNTVGLYALWVPLGAVLIALATSRGGRHVQRFVPWAFAAGGLAHLLYFVRVGGDFMHARLLLPGLLASLCAVSTLGISAARTLRSAARVALALLLVGWAVVCSSSLRVAVENEYGIGDERGWHAREARVENPVRLEDYRRFFFHELALAKKLEVARSCPRGLAALEDDSVAPCERRFYPDEQSEQLVDVPALASMPLAPDAAPDAVVAVVASRPLGIAGAVSGLRISLSDVYGLSEPLAARMELSGRGRPGHEKHLSTYWFAARYAAASATRDPRVAAAAAALACPALRELSLAIRAPLTVERFLQNLRASFRLHALRVPFDPEVARQQLCGS